MSDEFGRADLFETFDYLTDVIGHTRYNSRCAKGKAVGTHMKFTALPTASAGRF